MYNDITVVIVTFNPNLNILNRCLRSIDNQIKILIVDNSSNLKSSQIENYQNKKIKIIKNSNNGNGEAINVGMYLAKTQYILYLDVDTKLSINFIPKLINYINEIKDFAVIGPTLNNYIYKMKDYKHNQISNNMYSEMNFLEGAVMLINKSNTYLKNIKFDNNIFLYWEEVDFFHQCLINKKKIFLIKDLLADHDGGKSIDKIKYPDIELNRNWHYMWSKFYYYKKNFGTIIAYKKTLKHFFSATIKFQFYFLLRNKKYLIYLERLSGLFNSYCNKTSWRRPKVNIK